MTAIYDNLMAEGLKLRDKSSRGKKNKSRGKKSQEENKKRKKMLKHPRNMKVMGEQICGFLRRCYLRQLNGGGSDMGSDGRGRGEGAC